MMKLSFIVPALDYSDDLLDCVGSILAIMMQQTIDYEIILVVPELKVENFCGVARYCKVIPESSRGIYSAMNDGIKSSSGEYLYFMGTDDSLRNEFGSIFFNPLWTDFDVIFFDVLWGEKIYVNKPGRFSIVMKNTCHQGAIYSRKIFSRYGLFLRVMAVQADHYKNLRLLWDREHSWRICYLPIVGASYSGTGFSSRHNDEVFHKLYPLILKKYTRFYLYYAVVLKRFLRRIF